MRAPFLLFAALILTAGCSRTGDAERDPGDRVDQPTDTAPASPPSPNADADANGSPDSGTGAELDSRTPADVGVQDSRSDTAESDSSTPR